MERDPNEVEQQNDQQDQDQATPERTEETEPSSGQETDSGMVTDTANSGQGNQDEG